MEKLEEDSAAAVVVVVMVMEVAGVEVGVAVEKLGEDSVVVVVAVMAAVMVMVIGVGVEVWVCMLVHLEMKENVRTLGNQPVQAPQAVATQRLLYAGHHQVG